MNTSTPSHTSRLSRWTNYDAPLSQTALAVWFFFGASVCALVAMLPFMLFEHIIGWQPSHVAIWLGAVTSFPLAPGAYALLATMDRLVASREYPGNPMRVFLTNVRTGWHRLRGLWLAVPLFVLFIAYDAALLGSQVAWAVAVAVVLLVVFTIAASVVAASSDPAAPLRVTLYAALTSTLRRPHIPVTWAFLAVIAALLTQIPVVGPSLMLFVPAVWAAAVVIVNRTWAFIPPEQRADASAGDGPTD